MTISSCLTSASAFKSQLVQKLSSSQHFHICGCATGTFDSMTLTLKISQFLPQTDAYLCGTFVKVALKRDLHDGNRHTNTLYGTNIAVVFLVFIVFHLMDTLVLTVIFCAILLYRPQDCNELELS